MSPVVTIVVPSVLLGLAYGLARRELRLYRAAAGLGAELLGYGKGRLVRRLAGVAVLVALALTLAALGLFPPRTPAQGNAYLGVMTGELALLLALPIVDVAITARAAARRRRRKTQGRPPSAAS